jgi:DNA-binding MarR family transcriptional regulator
MDAVNFSIKRAHLALLRLGRSLLGDTGLTPARFDLMNALFPGGAKQSDLWRQLEVVRSVVSEMLGSLESLGWVERVRAGRTKLVKLTAAGLKVFEGVLDEYVASGDVGAWVDRAIAIIHDDPVVLALRQELIAMCGALRWTYRARPPFDGPDLYVVLGSPS